MPCVATVIIPFGVGLLPNACGNVQHAHRLKILTTFTLLAIWGLGEKKEEKNGRKIPMGWGGIFSTGR